MPKDSKNLFFSPEIAASLGLEEAIIFNLICDSSVGILQKNLNNELSFLQKKRFNDAVSRLLTLELIEEIDSKFGHSEDCPTYWHVVLVLWNRDSWNPLETLAELLQEIFDTPCERDLFANTVCLNHSINAK